MFRTSIPLLMVFATVSFTVVASHIVKGNNDNQPGQSRHDGKRAMDNNDNQPVQSRHDGKRAMDNNDNQPGQSRHDGKRAMDNNDNQPGQSRHDGKRAMDNNDNQPGQSRHDGKRAMDNMYKGMMESFKTSFVPGSKKDDGNTDASPSDWKNMIPGFAKGFIPDSAEDGADNSTVSEDAVADSSATNATSMDIEGSFHVNAAIKDEESVGEDKMTSQDGGSPDSTALPKVLSTDDNVPSEFGLLPNENDLTSTHTQSGETEAMETPADMSGKPNEPVNDMTQPQSDLTVNQAKESPANMETNGENTDTDLSEQEPSSDTRKVAMGGKASLKKDGKTTAEATEVDNKETVI